MTRVKRAVILLGVNMVILLAFEGLASVIVAGPIALRQLQTVAERVHTRYDQDLGWVNVPDLFIRDMYGPGISLRTNSQGFRNDRPFPKLVPPGRIRLVCSGDSFTLGYGVSNDDAWCNGLAAIDTRIEPVNMGQGGYGIDQAYLWYQRDGTQIDRDVHVFAFVTLDFARMRRQDFIGYGKPVITIDQDQLSVRNVPVPRRSGLILTMRTWGQAATNFRMVQLIAQLAHRTPQPSGGVPDGAEGDPLRPVVEKVFESLRDLDAQRGTVLVLVYLPVEQDYGTAPQPWRTFVHDVAARQGIALIDLVPELNDVSRQEAEKFFIGAREIPYRSSKGHYTVRGNQFIARALYRRLSAIEAVAAKFRTTSVATTDQEEGVVRFRQSVAESK